jgi:hypothetical protein
MKKFTAFLAAAAGAATLASAPAMAVPRDPPQVQLQKLLAGRVAGTPVDCIDLRSASSTQIIDGTAIVYRVGRKLYVNQPRAGASSLDDDDIMVTRTFGSRLCSVDTVHMVDRAARIPRGFVMLGKFVPYTKPKPAA